MLVFAREFAPHYHDRIVGLLRAADVEPSALFDVQHWFTVIALIAQGMGISLVPQSLSRSSMADVIYIEVDDANAEHVVEMIWHGDNQSNLASTFLRYIHLHGLS